MLPLNTTKKIAQYYIRLSYHSLTELQNQVKQIILCKVPAYIGIKGNEAAKQATNKSRMTKTRLSYAN